MDFPSPTTPQPSRAEVLLGYLDYFRDRLLAKVGSLSSQEQTSSRLPSGWTPLQLVHHLRHVERRWLEWGFEGRDVSDPWADERDGRWFVTAGFDELKADLTAQAGRTRAIVEAHDLADVGQPGPRWDGADPATLERVLLHLVQEYARHLGQVDIVAELVSGSVGE